MNKWLSLILAACLSFPLAAQDNNLQEAPGYVDFEALSSVYGEPRVMVNISGFLLKFMAAASKKEDPEAAALMRSLDAVRVNVYSTDGQLAAAQEQIASVKTILEKDGWQPVVQVKESDEEVQIFMKADDAGMQGLSVMTVNTEEAVFVNIIGDIDPSQLSMVMDQIDVDFDGE